jgi:Kinesin motor domain
LVQTGPKELTEESQGVNYRALNDLFHMSETRRDTFSYEISVQMVEIYNEQVRDLLSNNSGSNKRYPFMMFLLNFTTFLSKTHLNPEKFELISYHFLLEN